MTITYDGALALGPDQDDSRYYSMTPGTLPAADFAIFMLVRLSSVYVNDPVSVGSQVIRLASNYSAGGTGTGGGNSWFHLTPQNSSSTSNRMRINARLTNSANQVTSGGITATTVAAVPGDTVLLCLQRVAGKVEFWMVGNDGTPVLLNGAAQDANTGVTTVNTGTWTIGLGNNALTTQLFGMTTGQGFTSSQLAALRAGTLDLEDAVPAANRHALWIFNSKAASIPATWGANAATLTGSLDTAHVASPLVANAAQRISVTNTLWSFAAVSVNDDGTAPVRTWTGTYTGFTPTAMQARLLNLDGTVAQDWADLTGFTASGGTWSGGQSIPPGGLYRLEVRDKTTTSITWRGASAWLCVPTVMSIGQSPHTIFEDSGREVAVNPVAGIMRRSWVHPVRATQVTTSTGEAKMLNALAAAAGGRGAFIINASVSGTSSGQWAGRDSTVWPGMLAELDVVKPTRLLISWLNGAADTARIADNDAAGIKANHDTILANLDADLTSARGIGYRYRMLPHQRDTGTPTYGGGVRVAQYEWARDHAQAGTKVLIGPWWPDAQTDVETAGIAQGGTSSTITLAADDLLSGGSGSLADSPIAITSGTGAGQIAAVLSHNATTKVLTIRGTWSTIPDATSGYKVYGTSPHQKQALAVERYGTRYGQDIAAKYGYTTLSGRGPVPTSAAFPTGGDGSIIDVTFTHRHGGALRTPNGGTTATGVAGFTVDEGATNTTKAIASAVITGPRTVRLTLAAVPADKTKLKVRYGHYEPVAPINFNAIGGGLGDLLYDDTGVAPTGGNPAYFTTADLTPTDGAVTPPASPSAIPPSMFFAA